MAFDRSGVKGLPEGSNVQVIKEVPYVYFRYQWKDSTGKVKYARDYLGTIRCHTNFRHPFNLSWSGKTCDIRRSSKTTS